MAIGTDTGLQYAAGQDFFDYVLKRFYRDGVAETVINPNKLLAKIEANADETRVSGQDVVFPIHVGRAQAYGAIAPTGTLPGADHQKFAQYSFKVRHMYHRIKVDGASRDASEGDMGAWLRAWDTEIKGASVDLRRQRQRAYWNDGSGRLCEVASGVGPTTVIPVELHSGIDRKATCSTPATTHVKVGMKVAFVNDPSGSPTLVGVRTVNSVDSATQFTVDANITVSDGDAVCIASHAAASDLDDTTFLNEPMGIIGIVNDGNPLHDTYFQGVDATAAANTWNRANILDNGGVARAIDGDLLDEAYEKSIEIAEVEPNCIIGSFAMRRAVASAIKVDRRFNDTMNFDGGHSGINWNSVPIERDRDAWDNRLLFIDKSDLRMYRMGGGVRWMDADGSMLARVTDQDAYEGTLYLRETMGSDVRDRHTYLLDLLA